VVDALHHAGCVVTSVLVVVWPAFVLWRGWVTRPSRRRGAVPRRPSISPSHWRVGVALVAGTVAVVVVPPTLAVGVAAVVWLVMARRHRAAARATITGVADGLAEVVDLFALAASAGLTVPGAVDAVGSRAEGPLAVALRGVRDEIALGRRCADALDDLPRLLGETVRPLVAALVASERYGAPLVDGLERLAAEVRADHRRRAEERARRVPVQLLFPLVCCVLPAFALLTVAPLLIGAFGSLRL
jgi:tight adherence protein C